MPKYQIKTAPASEPVSLTEAKAHLRQDGSDNDTYITTLITTARRYCENYCNRKFIDQVWYEYYDKLVEPLRLSLNPVDSIVAIKYYDTDDTEQTLSSSYYTLDNKGDVGYIHEAVGYDFPNYSTDVINPVEVEYKTGYGTSSSDVPEDIRHAILFMISYFYENREGQSTMASYYEIPPPKAVKYLLNNYRIHSESD